MYTTLNEIEKEYLKKVRAVLDNGCELNAELLVELSVTLFIDLKIKDISDSECKEHDMLLYQYGTYDWGNEYGKHFSLDITRQFIDPEQYEPYQLRFTLIYDPEQFKNIAAYNCWSDTYTDINNFIINVKATDGFKVAVKNVPKAYQICFVQC